MIAGADGKNVVRGIPFASVLDVVDVGAELGDPERHSNSTGRRTPKEVAEIEVVMGEKTLLGSKGDIVGPFADRVLPCPGEIEPVGVVALPLQEYYSSDETVLLFVIDVNSPERMTDIAGGDDFKRSVGVYVAGIMDRVSERDLFPVGS